MPILVARSLCLNPRQMQATTHIIQAAAVTPTKVAHPVAQS